MNPIIKPNNGPPPAILMKFVSIPTAVGAYPPSLANSTKT